MLILQSHGFQKFRLVAIGIAGPVAAVPKGMDRVEHVHHSRADRQQLLYLWNGRWQINRRTKRHDQRRRESALLSLFMLCSRKPRIARSRKFHQQITERLSRAIADNYESPRTKATVIGGTKRYIENNVGLGMSRTGVRQWPARMADKKQQRGDVDFART